MSVTLMFRIALAWSRSVGGASVTAGLSSVGPPAYVQDEPGVGDLHDDRVAFLTTFAPNTDS
jgi:hypothetical protein